MIAIITGLIILASFAVTFAIVYIVIFMGSTEDDDDAQRQIEAVDAALGTQIAVLSLIALL